MTDSADTLFSIGTLVRVDGLQGSSAYNGCVGRVFGQGKGGRYKVCVRVGGRKSKKILVHPDNIRAVSRHQLVADGSLATAVRREHVFAPGHAVKFLRGPHKGLTGRVALGKVSRLHDPLVLVHVDTKLRGAPLACCKTDIRRVSRAEVVASNAAGTPTSRAVQRAWCRVLQQPLAGAGSKRMHRAIKRLDLVDALGRERARMVLQQQQVREHPGAWEELQRKIETIDQTGVSTVGKPFSRMDLDRARADLNQLKHIRELVFFFRDFVGLRRQIGGLIACYASLERHPVYCKGERLVITSGQWKDRNATVVEDCGWDLSCVTVTLNGRGDTMPVSIPKHISVKLPPLFRNVL